MNAASTLASRAASNPWDCETHRRALATPEEHPLHLLTQIARILHRWPDETALCLHKPKKRLRRLLKCVAGYPEVILGGLPFDQPLHPLAEEALTLTLALDSWPALSGRHSLRSELMWLDRLNRAKASIAEDPLTREQWLHLTFAWLLAGLAAPSPGPPAFDTVLYDVLYNSEELEQAVTQVEPIVKALVTAARTPNASEFPKLFAVVDRAAGEVLPRIAERLWWIRAATPLTRHKRSSAIAPSVEPPLPTGAIEVRFHQIQRWLRSAQDWGSDAESGKRLALSDAAMRGASTLLEAVLSALRLALLKQLGCGGLLIDGGGRLRFLCEPDGQVQRKITDTVTNTIDTLFDNRSSLGKRFGAVLKRLEEQGALGPLNVTVTRDDRVQAWRELAWAAIPSISVTLYEHFDPERNQARPLVIPIRRRASQPRLPAIWPTTAAKRAFRRKEQPMSPVRRLYVELGVEIPRLRQLSVRLAHQADRPLPVRLPLSTGPVQQMLALDLNRVGTMFTRRREHEDSEARSRRSLRFTAHWLLAIRRTTNDLDEAAQAQVMVMGGDDLVVATRVADSDLTSYPMRLQQHLRRFNDELPECDRVSFSAGVARRSTTPGGRLYDAAFGLQRLGKRLWLAEALNESAKNPAPPMASSVLVNRLGAGHRLCLIITAPVDAGLTLSDDEPTTTAYAAGTRFEIASHPDINVLSMQELEALVAATLKDSQIANSGMAAEGFAFLLEIDLSSGSAVIELAPRGAASPKPPECEVCAAPAERRRSPRGRKATHQPRSEPINTITR